MPKQPLPPPRTPCHQRPSGASILSSTVTWSQRKPTIHALTPPGRPGHREPLTATLKESRPHHLPHTVRPPRSGWHVTSCQALSFQTTPSLVLSLLCPNPPKAAFSPPAPFTSHGGHPASTPAPTGSLHHEATPTRYRDSSALFTVLSLRPCFLPTPLCLSVGPHFTLRRPLQKPPGGGLGFQTPPHPFSTP